MSEELGLELVATDVTLLGFVVDMAFSQWNVVGTLDTRLTAAEVLAAHRLHARDRWEGRLEIVPSDAEIVFERLHEGGAWDTALITSYLAFSYRYGVRQTQAAAERVFGPQKRQPKPNHRR